jgi:hypothetical protein
MRSAPSPQSSASRASETCFVFQDLPNPNHLQSWLLPREMVIEAIDSVVEHSSRYSMFLNRFF